jgi:hypothetical protein
LLFLPFPGTHLDVEHYYRSRFWNKGIKLGFDNGLAAIDFSVSRLVSGSLSAHFEDKQVFIFHRSIISNRAAGLVLQATVQVILDFSSANDVQRMQNYGPFAATGQMEISNANVEAK